MKTLQQLLDNTPDDVKERSMQVSATVISATKSKKKSIDTIVFVVRCRAITETVFYDVEIELYPTTVKLNVWEKPDFDHPAWVQCSCPFFLFNCEYALAKHGSSEIKYSNGKPPHITNPKQIPMVCKHLVQAAFKAIESMQKIAVDTKKYTFQ